MGSTLMCKNLMRISLSSQFMLDQIMNMMVDLKWPH
jgi:hypothetical protein